MLCKNCYDLAKRLISKQITTIPGAIDTTAMIKIGKDLGRCHVCDTSQIIWWDEEQHMGLCGQSYTREVKAAEKRGVHEK